MKSYRGLPNPSRNTWSDVMVLVLVTPATVILREARLVNNDDPS